MLAGRNPSGVTTVPQGRRWTARIRPLPPHLAGARDAGWTSAMAMYERCAGPASMAAIVRAAAARTCSRSRTASGPCLSECR